MAAKIGEPLPWGKRPGVDKLDTSGKNIWDKSHQYTNPGNALIKGDSWGAMGARMLLGGAPTSGDIVRPFNAIGSGARKLWNGIKSSIGGQNSYEPQDTNLDQTMANTDRDLSFEGRGNQSYLGAALRDQMSGNGPTVAGLQAQQGVAQAMQNASSQANNARGTSRALAQRSAMYAGMQAQATANRDASLMRAQEQLSAQQQLSGVAQDQRTGDTQNRSLDLEAAKADQSADLTRQGYKTSISEGNATRRQKGAGAVFSGLGGLAKGLLSDERAKSEIQPVNAPFGDPQTEKSFAQALKDSMQVQPQEQTQDQGLRYLDSVDASYAAEEAAKQRAAATAAETNASTAGGDTSGSGMSAGGIGGAIGGGIESFGNGLMSDERNKTDLAPITPYRFRYRPEMSALLAEQAAGQVPERDRDAVRAETYSDARSPRLGVMAQDLEESPGGRKVVKETPVGKMLQSKRALGFALANQAGLDKRLRKIEEVIGG